MGFFNDLKDTVKDTGKDLSNKAKVTSDNAKLKSQIRTNERSISDLTMQIGTRYLNTRCSGELDPEFSDLVTEIRRLQDENASLNSSIASNSAPAGSKQCTNCGQFNAPEAKFCVSCGAEIKTPEPVKEEAPAADKYCPACGGANTASAAFCVHCGKPFEAQPEAAAEEPSEPEA